MCLQFSIKWCFFKAEETPQGSIVYIKWSIFNLSLLKSFFLFSLSLSIHSTLDSYNSICVQTCIKSKEFFLSISYFNNIKIDDTKIVYMCREWEMICRSKLKSQALGSASLHIYPFICLRSVSSIYHLSLLMIYWHIECQILLCYSSSFI